MPTLQQIAANLAQVAQDLLAYANVVQPVTYEGEYTATAKKSYQKQCSAGIGENIDYIKSSTQKKSSNLSKEDAVAKAKEAAEAEANRLVNIGGQEYANEIGKCHGVEEVNPIPTVFIPSKPWLVKSEVVGLVGANILWKITDSDNHSRSYLNVGNTFNNVGSNIYTNPDFKLKTGLTLEYVKNGIIDAVTGNGGLVPDQNAFKFNTDEADAPGDEDVLPEEPPIVIPPATSQRPPLFIYLWGFYWGRELSRTAIEDNKTHFAEQSAMSDPRFIHQRPWFAVDIPEQNVTVCYKYDQNAGQYLTDVRKVRTDWQGTPANMDEFIIEMRRAKLDFLNFLYYADTYQGALMRNQYKAAVHKRGLNACYTIVNIGGDRNNKHIPTDDYAINLARIVQDLDAPWYQKIDGKPAVFFLAENTPENYANATQDRDNIREAYGKPIYEVFLELGYNPDYSYLESKGYNARSWYYNYDDHANGDHSLESVITSTIQFTRNHAQAGKHIIPQVTSFDQRARQHYPGDSVQWDRPGFTGHPNSFYYPTTKEQFYRQIDGLLEVANEYPDNVKAIGLGIGDENSETGVNVFMMKKNADGTINKQQADWCAEKFVNY